MREMSPLGARDDRASRSWSTANLVGGVLSAVMSICVFTPWFRHAPCPAVRGLAGGCDAPWRNVLGLEFHGAFPYWVPVLAGLLGFVAGWTVVALVRAVVREATK